MPPATRMDAFANRAIASVTMSAANTLTFAQIQFGVGIFQGVGLVLHRVYYLPTAAVEREVVAATDNYTIALTTSNQLSSIQDDDPSIIHNFTRIGVGAAVEVRDRPVMEDFCEFPGGGIILPPNPLYVGMASDGFVAAGVAQIRLWFTFKQLSDKDYIELIQSRLPANI